jgi:hypothetical protein
MISIDKLCKILYTNSRVGSKIILIISLQRPSIKKTL